MAYLQNENTYVPTITASGSNPTVTYTTQLGWYQKIGNWCDVNIVIVINTFSGGSGSVRVSLPFTATSDSGYVAVGGIIVDGVAFPTSAAYLQVNVNAGNAYCGIQGVLNNAGRNGVSVGNLANGDTMFITVRYKTA